MGVLSYFSSLIGAGAGTRAMQALGDSDRQREYARYHRAYRGYRNPNPHSTESPATASSVRRIRYNFNKPVVDLGAAFLAAKPLGWTVDGNRQAQDAARGIWDRSGKERVFIEAARTCGIYGDMVGIAGQDDEGRPRIEFVSPDICFPTFDGADASRLVALEMSWREEDRDGRATVRREFFDESGRQVFINDEEQVDKAQAWDRIPAAWIKNLSLKGLPFGLSDLEGIVDLVEEFDHVASRRSKAIDYYAQPSQIWSGVKSTDMVSGEGKIYFVPAEAKVYYLQWQGAPPDVKEHLTTTRTAIQEISRVPAVAFGQQDSGFSSISGVALKILYGPLITKTNDKWGTWGPPLEYLMWLCLRAEGFEVKLEAVNVVWTDPLPVDTRAQAEEEALEVSSGLKSIETAITALGSEDPRAELTRIQSERKPQRLRELVDAGIGIYAAALEVGYSEEEALALVRTDVDDGLEP